jgi:hypothetical protein
MLRTLVARGGLRRQRSRREGLPPAVLFGHFTLALTGLALWGGYVVTGWLALAWPAVGVLMPAIGLGISTVTLWTPFADTPAAPGQVSGPQRAGRPGGMLASPAEDMLVGQVTDEVLASAAADEALIGRLVEEVVAGARADPARGGRKPRGHLTALIPVGHGIGALVTFLLAVITAAGAT